MAWVFRDDIPIYTQLMERIERMIVSGVLKAGERMPSVRTIAVEAGVNPNTVQKAMTELERSGLIYSQSTAGNFVTGDAGIIAAAREALAAEQAGRFLLGMTELGYGPEETEKLLRRQLQLKGAKANAHSEL